MACPVLKQERAAGVRSPLHFQLVLNVLNIGTEMLKYGSMYADF
jgi:hypothetical protein